MNRIYLVGLPGVGKSTSGKRFAKKLGWGYADLDKLVAIRAGMKIPQLFEAKGEAYFRELEQEVLHETKQSNFIVIGCGGGTAAWFNNMAWMLQHGRVIWLNIKLEELTRRLTISVNDRPMFPDREPELIQQKLSALLEVRKPYYEQAHIEVKSETELLSLSVLP
ncbi:MAG: shikimate kinase [Bacteroidia bacterium]